MVIRSSAASMKSMLMTGTSRPQELCSFWRDWELELLQPRLIVTVGGLALRRLLGLASLTPCVGERYERDGAVVIPLPHPSGASGWLASPPLGEMGFYEVEAGGLLTRRVGDKDEEFC